MVFDNSFNGEQTNKLLIDLINECSQNGTILPKDFELKNLMESLLNGESASNKIIKFIENYKKFKNTDLNNNFNNQIMVLSDFMFEDVYNFNKFAKKINELLKDIDQNIAVNEKNSNLTSLTTVKLNITEKINDIQENINKIVKVKI